MWTFDVGAHQALLAVATGTTNAVSQAADSFSNLRVILFIAIALSTGVGLHLASRAVAPIAEVVKSVIAAGLGLLLIAAAVALALVLAITSI